MSGEYEKARQYALRRVSAQSYHSAMLAGLLDRKKYPPEIISKIIHDFIEKGFLNDEFWVQSYVRIHHKRQSRRQILAKLRSKGISVEDLDLPFDEETELETIKKLIETRYRTKERPKVIAALMRRGYPWDLIQAALK